MLYDSENCPCLITDCDLYRKCDECKERHHSSDRYPLTACEICDRDGCEYANPAVSKRSYIDL